ncbi:YcgJ family protein [Paraburkholderia humisilvae]|uniref:Fels-1 Prophage Protein-like protein n=1 Tax=Paraburkholderia humisilvae TaxID=627669 RepID=A0A6J5F4V0_9BURK|nr:YcgJ family protein [Paraburkholderia humisilvae]CAB3773880.1 hypothetical protein LMG29542_07480 [Paraburkholderia humisilvae]
MNQFVRFACLTSALVAGLSVGSVGAERVARLRSFAPGVLCDRYFCATDEGISLDLTKRYLGKRAATKLFSQGEFDVTEFTFANGIFCDVKERLCRENRYYGENGKHNGAVSERYTELLFGN